MENYLENKIRINKISITINKQYDEVRISLYKTNELLGVLTEEDLDLIPYSEAGVSIKAYQNYCKDLIIALLEADGISGYYYEPKEDNTGIKYTPFEFKSGIKQYVENILHDKYEYSFPMTQDRLDIKEKYKDHYIKDATGEFDVDLIQYNIRLSIVGEIKSGQLCRPRIIRYDGMDYAFNITNVSRIIKQNQ